MSSTGFWKCFHWFSMQDASFHEKHNLEDFMERLRIIYNDSDINAEWEPKKADEDHIEWSLRLHNKVSAHKNQYSNWDRQDFHIAYKIECDVCNNKEFVFLFPWKLIYKLAGADFNGKSHVDVSDRATLVSIIKEFNNIYPCTKCNGRLIIDDPQQDEDLYDWIVRNKKRFNVERNKDEMLDIPPQKPVYIPPEEMERIMKEHMEQMKKMQEEGLLPPPDQSTLPPISGGTTQGTSQ